MTWVAGVDGCPGGWLAVLRDTVSGRASHCFLKNISEVLDLPDNPEVVTVDIPIGLLEEARVGGRECDRLARGVLGHPRSSSVFSPPVRSALRHEREYALALAENRRSSSDSIGISRQSFGLFPKIREIDEWMNVHLQNRVREVHPELSFCAMNAGRPMHHGKKKVEGLGDRHAVLARNGFSAVIEKTIAETHRRAVGKDDILDACAACWTAERILAKTARQIPECPEHDKKGFRMEMLC